MRKAWIKQTIVLVKKAQIQLLKAQLFYASFTYHFIFAHKKNREKHRIKARKHMDMVTKRVVKIRRRKNNGTKIGSTKTWRIKYRNWIDEIILRTSRYNHGCENIINFKKWHNDQRILLRNAILQLRESMWWVLMRSKHYTISFRIGQCLLSSLWVSSQRK